ncbi:iron donor protein CyaY [Candidatus Adlerbacteria bacterium RIFOXYB1_FULL_48_10]|nr:MAG: iron donor protein CyaY [Candidatus Adlerbacteria bacterium RIFOXYB1_FULL_48_10]
MTEPQLSEPEFRAKVQGLFDRIDRAFTNVDPDLAESERGLGTLTITFKDGSKCILSTQPSLQQVWMALASKGMAFHFIQEPRSGLWIDDKGKGIELISYLQQFLKDSVKLELKI